MLQLMILDFVSYLIKNMNLTISSFSFIEILDKMDDF